MLNNLRYNNQYYMHVKNNFQFPKYFPWNPTILIQTKHLFYKKYQGKRIICRNYLEKTLEIFLFYSFTKYLIVPLKKLKLLVCGKNNCLLFLLISFQLFWKKSHNNKNTNNNSNCQLFYIFFIRTYVLE